MTKLLAFARTAGGYILRAHVQASVDEMRDVFLQRHTPEPDRRSEVSLFTGAKCMFQPEGRARYGLLSRIEFNWDDRPQWLIWGYGPEDNTLRDVERALRALGVCPSPVQKSGEVG